MVQKLSGTLADPACNPVNGLHAWLAVAFAVATCCTRRDDNHREAKSKHKSTQAGVNIPVVSELGKGSPEPLR